MNQGPPTNTVWSRPGRRIHVVGSTGSGKTTVARELAHLLHYRHVELDALHWRPGWTEAPLDQFRDEVAAALAGDGWVVDGNYSKVRDLVWARADTIVWLDYSLGLVLRRLVRRTIGRVVRRELLWGTNRESVRLLLFSRDSLFWWALKTYHRRRREYRALLTHPDQNRLTVIHHQSPAETDVWLARLTFRPPPL